MSASFKDTFEPRTFWARAFKCGAFRGSSSTVAPVLPALEYTLPINRMHYTIEENRLRYTLRENRLHYTVKDNEP